jgi:uncharacterized DUF497 family protein
MDKPFEWSPEKNRTLKALRGISFEEVSEKLKRDDFLDNSPHHNLKKYPNQRIFTVTVRNYVYLVPFVEDENRIFLKTIIPSRKANKKYNQPKGGKHGK